MKNNKHMRNIICGLTLCMVLFIWTVPAQADLATSANWTGESDQADAGFGSPVTSAGDVNGDGYNDVIIGAPYYDNGQADEGRAYLYFGSETGLSTTASWTAESNQAGANFGYSGASAGDVNNDGYDDVIISAPFYDNGEVDEGRAYLFFGSPTGPSLTADWFVESDQIGARMGGWVAGGGDVNADGYADILVAAAPYDNVGTNEGRVYAYYGSASGPSTTPDWTVEGDQADAYLGTFLSTAGDVNNDGYDDVIVGAAYYDNGEADEGRAYVYNGSPAGLSTTASWTAESNQAGANFGWSVSSAGDVNNDSYADVIVSAPVFSDDQIMEGRVYVYNGSGTGLSLTSSWTIDGNQDGALIGVEVGSAGDINTDGYSDVLVGAPYYDNGQVDEGRAYAYHGSAMGLSTTPNWTVESDQADALFGYNIASAGDVNNDSVSDVIVGSYLYNSGGAAFLYLGSPHSPICTFTEAVSNDFNTPGNWDCGVVPGDGDSAIIPVGTTANLSASVSFEALNTSGTVNTLGNSMTVTTTALINAGGTLNASTSTVTLVDLITNVGLITVNTAGGGKIVHTAESVKITDSAGTEVSSIETAGGTLYITVQDSNRNLDGTAIETINVPFTANAAAGNDAETLTLTETTVSSGIFRNTAAFNVVHATNVSPESGQIEINNSGIGTASYTDSQDITDTANDTVTLTDRTVESTGSGAGGRPIPAPTPEPTPTATPTAHPAAPGPSDRCAGFPDVWAGHPDCEAITYVKSIGAMTGHGDGTFGGDQFAQRDHMAKITLMTFRLFEPDVDYCKGTQPFIDISIADWSYQYICQGKAMGKITGYLAGPDEGLFLPASIVTRIEVLAFLLRNLSETMPEKTEPSYSDIPVGHWYSGFAAYSKQNGLFTGDELFPIKPVSRIEIARMLFKLHQLNKI